MELSLPFLMKWRRLEQCKCQYLFVQKVEYIHVQKLYYDDAEEEWEELLK
jgi:hypothetical protein